MTSSWARSFGIAWGQGWGSTAANASLTATEADDTVMAAATSGHAVQLNGASFGGGGYFQIRPRRVARDEWQFLPPIVSVPEGLALPVITAYADIQEQGDWAGDAAAEEQEFMMLLLMLVA